MRVFIAGDTGLLGKALLETACGSGHQVFGVSTSPFPDPGRLQNFCHECLDLSQKPDTLSGMLKKFDPDVVINAAALVDLSLCEKNEALARLLNTETAGWLAKLCAGTRARFVHISTDQVFDGKKQTPYTENDRTNPLNVYGKTKLAGEEAVLRADPQALFLRTNIVGFRGRADKPVFAEWLTSSLAEKKKISLADDFVTSSLHVRFFGELLFLAVQKKLSGVYHIASHDSASKYAFGERLAQKMGESLSSATRVKLRDLALQPERPPYLALDVSRAEAALGKAFPGTAQTTDLLAEEYLGALKK